MPMQLSLTRLVTSHGIVSRFKIRNNDFLRKEKRHVTGLIGPSDQLARNDRGSDL